MTDSLVYTYRGSWCAEGLNTTWECDWRAIGRSGTVFWDGADQYRCEAVAQAEGFRSTLEPVPVPPHEAGRKVGGHAGCIAEFVDCVRQGGVPETAAADNIKSLAMVFGAIASAESGRRERVTW